MVEDDDAAYFQNAEFSDCEVSINVLSEGLHVVLKPSGPQITLLLQQQHVAVRKFPGHRVILRRCRYFASQARLWQKDSSSTCTLELTVDSEDQVPAAEAVIAGLYCSTNALLQLPIKQLLYAAVLADRHAADRVAPEAVALLSKAAETQLPQVLEALAAQPAWPDFLLPVIPAVVVAWQALDAAEQAAHDQRIQAVLVAALRDLTEVWRDQAQQDVLLNLPLPAMRLLLESDYLIVDSEDTVYYTAAQYVSRQPADQQIQAIGALAPEVRCPQLSHFCLSNLALTTDDSLLLSSYQPQLRQLLSLSFPFMAGLSSAEERPAKRIKLAVIAGDKVDNAPAS